MPDLNHSSIPQFVALATRRQLSSRATRGTGVFAGARQQRARLQEPRSLALLGMTKPFETASENSK
jgi:hypothetical protein